MLHLIAKYYCNLHGTTAMFPMLLLGTMLDKFMLSATALNKVFLLFARFIFKLIVALSRCCSCVHGDTARFIELLLYGKCYCKLLEGFWFFCIVLGATTVNQVLLLSRSATEGLLLLQLGAKIYRNLFGFYGKVLLLCFRFYCYVISFAEKCQLLLLVTRF
ncbi:hypothetical protein M0804_014353 [Polistes exclamans]|nr:hypothetical protein M0804_014353 [Polistes exclamans]